MGPMIVGFLLCPPRSTSVMSQDIADRRTYADYVTSAFGAMGW